VARVELPREENRGRLQLFVGLAKVSVLLLQHLDLRQLLAARPGRPPASTWACNTHLRNVSGPTPSFGPSAWATPHAEPYSSSRSTAIRVARTRCSVGYLFAMICILRKKGSGIKPGTVHGDGEGDEWWFAERAPEPAACYLSFRPWPVNRWGDGPHQPRPIALLDQGPLNLISANDLEPPFTPAFPRTHRARGPDGRPRIRCGTLLFKCLYPW